MKQEAIENDSAIQIFFIFMPESEEERRILASFIGHDYYY